MARFAAAAVALILVVAVQAEEKKADPTGTWKWSTERNGQTFETTLKLKLEGDKLTGTVSGRQNDSKIEDATYKNGEFKFKVTREFNGNKFVMNYSGKVTGDTIKGKTEMERDGQKVVREFEGKRQKDEKK